MDENSVLYQGIALQVAEKATNVCTTVEERPFEGRVSGIKFMRALALVVVVRRSMDLFPQAV